MGCLLTSPKHKTVSPPKPVNQASWMSGQEVQQAELKRLEQRGLKDTIKSGGLRRADHCPEIKDI